MLRFCVLLLGVASLFLVSGMSCNSQQILRPGQPHINSLQPTKYPQNWDFAQDSTGIIYIANQGGVVEYDGVHWIPYDTIKRSVYSLTFDKHGNLHIGAEGELGFFSARKPDTSMVPVYVSLIDSLPKKYQNVGNVWQTERKKNWIYYNNLQHIFAFNGHQVKVLKPATTFSFIHPVHNVLYVQSKKDAIYRLEGGTLVRDEYLTKHFSDKKLSLLLPAEKGGVLAITESGNFHLVNERKITPYNHSLTDAFENEQIYRGVRLRDGSYMLGTLGKGLVRLSKEGSIISHINKKVGLPDNMVFNLFEANDGLLWTAFNESIATVEVHSPIRRANEANNLEGMITDIKRLDNYLLVASSDGLYKTVLEPNQNNNIPHFAKIIEMDDVKHIVPISKHKILYSARNGLYTYDLHKIDGESKRISSLPGVKKILYDGNKFRFFAGNTNGIYQYSVDSSFQKIKQTKLITLHSAVTNMVLKDNTLWAGTLLDGVKKIDLSTDQVHTFKVPHRNLTKSVKVTQIRDTVYIAGTTGLYKINTEGELIQSVIFGDFSADSTRQFFLVKEDDGRNVWMRSNGAHQVARSRDDGTYGIEKKWLSRITDRQINVIYPDPYEPGLIWMGGADGLVSYHTDKDNLDDEVEKFSSIIRSVKINGDSVVANEHSGPKVFKYQHRNLRFNYAATHFQEPTLTQYQVLLDGFDNTWSAWTNETQKDYTNITEGIYTFKVRAKDLFGRVTQTAGFTFTIKPPWFRTWWAYSLYVLIVAGIAYGAHMWRVKRLLHIYKLRNNIARDLHDEVSATLSSISFFASAAKMDNTPQDEKKYINLIEQSSNDAKEKINDIIWSVDPEKDSWSLFVAKCRRYAADLLESRDIEHDIQMVSECDISLDLRLRQNLWLIYKEIVTNAARHSRADNVKISCKAEGKKLMLTINDNGSGIEQPDSQSGNGIKNIYKRADEIGAKVTLNTDSKKGTQWKVEISQ